ncbi:MAG: CIA30 family protein [Victivallales bacterium]|nr:CIA30 family protein [Victivallales bacterium]
MKKTVLILLLFGLASSWCHGDDNAASQRRIVWNRANTLLSHPYYTSATLQQSGIGKNLRFTFVADKKRLLWAMALIKISPPLSSGWTAVQISYRARIPAGMQLCCAWEENDEVTYEKKWRNGSNGAFTTITIPLSQFAVSSWSRRNDKNSRLDLSQIRTVLIGAVGEWDGSGDKRGEIEIGNLVLQQELPLRR